MSDIPAVLLHLADVHAGFVAGLDIGEAHGRATERAVIDQERLSIQAAAAVAGVATSPELDPNRISREGAARSTAVARLMTRRPE